MTDELEAIGRNVYLLQASLDKVSRAARAVVSQWDNDSVDMRELDVKIQRLAKALASK